MSKQNTRFSAFDSALYYLTFKDRTLKEICSKLKEKGYSDSEIDETVLKLQKYGYINEKNYAFSYIKSNINKKGSKLITMELCSKGIPKDIILEELDEFDQQEEDCILNMLSSKYSDVDLEDDRQVRRIYSFFARRGFKYDSISNALSIYRKNIKIF